MKQQSTYIKSGLPLLLLFFILCTPALVQDQASIKQIDIYVENRWQQFAAPLRAKELTRPGLFTQYTLVNPRHFAGFNKIIAQIPAHIKAKQKQANTTIHIVAKIFYTNGSHILLGMSTHFEVSYNGNATNVKPQAFLDLMRPFIAPVFNWHTIDAELRPDRMPKKYRNYTNKFDGFLVEFSSKTKQFFNTKKIRQSLFTAKEYERAFDLFNEAILIGIDWRQKKVVSIHFAIQEPPHMEQGDMSAALYKKYMKIMNEQLSVVKVQNFYRIQSDVIYKMVEFK